MNQTSTKTPTIFMFAFWRNFLAFWRHFWLCEVDLSSQNKFSIKTFTKNLVKIKQIDSGFDSIVEEMLDLPSKYADNYAWSL